MSLHEPDRRRRNSRRQDDEPKPRIRRRPPPSPNAFAYSLPDACAMSGFGKTSLYELMKDGRLQYKEIDGRRKIIGDSLRALLGV
jgi:hypothetical protein